MFTYQVNEDIVLRLPNETDAPNLFKLFEENRVHLTEWQDWPNKIQTIGDCRNFILDHQQDYGKGTSLECLIIFRGNLVGMCSLSKIVHLLRKAEIGYWIAKDYEGHGIVTQSCKGLMTHAFETLNLNRLALKFKHVSNNHENVRSRRVADRLGFTQEGILRQDGMTKGQLMDMVMCSLLAEEWQNMQNDV